MSVLGNKLHWSYLSFVLWENKFVGRVIYLPENQNNEL